MMQSDGNLFLEHLANFPRYSFEGRFLNTSITLSLGKQLTADELKLLYEAALYASFCNIAFNGLGGCQGEIRPDQETNRTGLELQFMAARDRVRSCESWGSLKPWQRDQIEKDFLRVFVDESNLAQ
jgi:hypothetical protein